MSVGFTAILIFIFVEGKWRDRDAAVQGNQHRVNFLKITMHLVTLENNSPVILDPYIYILNIFRQKVDITAA